MAVPVTSETAAGPGALPGRSSVLLVDDRPDNLLALEAVLEPLGLTTVPASSGEEALRCLLAQDFDLIILDVQMPGMDGFETARLIKGRERTRHIPIVFLTAISGAVEHHLLGYASGGVDYVYKPFEPEILRAKVSALLELVQLKQALEREIAERTASQARLADRESQLAEAEALAHVGAWSWDMASGAVTWSDELYRIFGLEPTSGPVTYEAYLERLHPEDRAAVDQAVRECRQTGEPYQVEHRVLHPDGSTVWVRGKGHMVLREGRPVQVLGVAQDITARRRAEEEFTQFFSLSLDLMAVADFGGSLIRVNQSFSRVLGWSARELLSRSYLDLLHPDDREWATVSLGRLAEGEEVQDSEVRMVCRDGRFRWFRTSAKPVPDDGLIYVVGIDITERKATAALLAESEERFRALVEHAPEAIVVLDIGTGRFVEANLEAERLLGQSRSELANLGCRDVSAPVQPDGSSSSEVAAQWIARARAGESGPVEWLARGVSGNEVLCEIRLLALPGSEPCLVRASVTDITERRRAEKVLGEMAEQERAFSQSRQIAQALQRSLLPEELPDIPGLSLAVRYVPGSDGLEVGGDFYDVFALQHDSPPGAVAVVIGDIVGHGLRAAATMGQLRTTLRAYALEQGAPTKVMARLEYLPKTLPEAEMATLLYAMIQPDAGILSFVSAGHPPPLLLRADGTASYLEGGRTAPLGVPALPSPEGLVAIEPGSTLIFYTDGLVERRGFSLDHGLASLKQAACSAAGEDPESICDAVMAAMSAGGILRDDVALLAVGVVPAPRTHFRFSGTVDPHHLAPLRRALTRWIAAMGATVEESGDLVLATSEAVTNSMVHAYGLEDGVIEVEATVLAQEVTVTVRDAGGWRSGTSQEGGRGLSLMRALTESVDVNAGAGGTVVRLRRRLGRPLPARLPRTDEREALPVPGNVGDLIAVARPADDIDQWNVNATALSLARAVSNQQIGLLLDLSGLSYMDSSGIRLLFELRRRLGRRRQKLWVYVPASSPIYRILEIAPFDAVVPAGSVEEAMASIRASAGRTHTGGWVPEVPASP